MILLESKGVYNSGERTTRADLVAAEVIIVAELRTMLACVKGGIITHGASLRRDAAVNIVFSSTVLDCTPFCWRWDILTKMVCTVLPPLSMTCARGLPALAWTSSCR
jgi:hypothetical protein